MTQNLHGMIDTGLHDAILLTPKPKDPGIFFNRTSKTPMWVIHVFAKFFVLFCLKRLAVL